MGGLSISLVMAATLVAAPTLAQSKVEQPIPVTPMAPEAKAYLDDAIAIFRKSHINGAKADWPSITAKAFAAAAGAKTTSDTYPAIELIIKELGEKHTVFWDPDTAKANATGAASGSASAPILALAEVDKFADGVGVIRLYGFMGSEELGRQYADYARSRINWLRSEGVCRFILDLRNNTGGVVYPMLSALSPLLDDGVLGIFDYADGRRTYWGLKNGEGVETADIIPASTARKGEVLPVAVLIGPRTLSSGEFTAMSFRGRPNTRFFGLASGGYVTSNDPFKLSDGATIIMTDSWGTDRTGKRYVEALQPDEITSFGGPTIEAAKGWLSRQPCPSDLKISGKH